MTVLFTGHDNAKFFVLPVPGLTAEQLLNFLDHNRLGTYSEGNRRILIAKYLSPVHSKYMIMTIHMYNGPQMARLIGLVMA